MVHAKQYSSQQGLPVGFLEDLKMAFLHGAEDEDLF